MSANEAASRRARSGGYAAAAAMTPEQRSERARKAVAARWERENDRRAVEGLPPTKKTPQPLDADALAYWLSVVDEKFGADYPWKFPSDRKRQALAMARADAARQAAEHFARTGREHA